TTASGSANRVALLPAYPADDRICTAPDSARFFRIAERLVESIDPGEAGVVAEPSTWIVRCAGRGRLRRGRPRRDRRVIALADLGHQPLLLALRVPPAQRLGRAANRLGDLFTLHPGDHQRQRTRVLLRGEPPTPRRHTLTLATT